MYIIEKNLLKDWSTFFFLHREMKEHWSRVNLVKHKVWNAKLTETRIFRELSIEIESSLIQLNSSLIQLKSSLIQLESSLIQLLSSLYMYN